MIVRNHHYLDIDALPSRGIRRGYGFLDPTITAHGRRWRQWFRLRVFRCCFDLFNTLAGNCTGISYAIRVRGDHDGQGIKAACTHKAYLVVARSYLPSLGIANRVTIARIDLETWRGSG